METGEPLESGIRVAVVDDHALFRSGLKGLLARTLRYRVVAEGANGMEAVAIASGGGFDIMLLDIDMPVMGGIEAAAEILEERPDTKIIALSMHNDRDYCSAMVSAGVKGFLPKDSSIDEVAAAIESVAHGGSYFPQELLQSLVLNPAAEAPAEDELSPRELEIVPLVCKGMSNQEIADKLFISKRTVDKHRANILEKTGCRNTANLVVYAIKKGLAEL